MLIWNKRTVLAGICSFICVLAAGCGDGSQSMEGSGAQGQQASGGNEGGTQRQQAPDGNGNPADADREDTVAWLITESALPLPEDALTQDILKEDNWVAREKESCFWDGTFYLLSDLFEMVDEKNIFAGACIQVLSPPYEQWENRAYFYQEHYDDDISVQVSALAGVADDGILVETISFTDEKPYLACLTRDGSLEVLMEMPEDFTDGLWYQDGEQLQVLSGGGRTLTAFDQTGQQGTTRNLTGKVIGFLENPRDGGKSWYGFEGDELVLWDKPGGQVRARVTDQINQFKDFGIAYDASGEVFLADAGGIWAYDGQTAREVCSFPENGYAPEELYGLGVREDGVLLVLAKQDGSPCLLAAETADRADTADRSDTTDRAETADRADTADRVDTTDRADTADRIDTAGKQEILIVINNANPALEKLAARYSRQSGEYRVRIVPAMEEADPEDYRTRVQMEMAAGSGPDLLGDWTVNVSECVKQGYLEPLDGVAEDRNPFLESAFAAGEADGTLYGIPYYCYPYFMAVSDSLKDTDSWTLEEMYEAVRNSTAEVLEAGADGVNIIMACGLHDEENKAFIDWEKGESHLTEEPFLRLMEFAKKYADQGRYPRSEVGERLADGRIASVQIVLSDPGMLNRASGCFGGEEACIGYPRESGSGIYMETARLYLNSSAGNREGAMDFLRYLISEEGQRQYMEDSSKSGWQHLPVRRGLLQESLDRYQREVKDPPGQSWGDDGIFFQWEKLDEGQVETFWRILDNAVPAVFRSDDIWTMVDEELQPYFNGERSAQEAAAVLHNRVQLYLDEQK